MSGYVVAIDQGTTSTRAIVFDDRLRVRGIGQQEFTQHFLRPGWVEHDPADLWQTSVETVRLALADAGLSAADIAAIGIANQRETTLVWDRRTGEPIHRAIVWQDRRTADLCARLKTDGHEPMITSKTGLIIDPYFSGTKVAWLLDAVTGARSRAVAGELAFGTVDSWLIWNLTGGKRHVTDATNASRTLLYNIRDQDWDTNLLALLGIPAGMLPEVHDCAAAFGVTSQAIFGAEIPILGVAGDQQAATLGQACFSPGMVKSTYGTGCFAVLNTGAVPVASKNRLLTTLAYRLDGQITYALEGAIFIAGAAVQWLRDGLGILERADQSGPMAAEADPEQPVYLVPAFTGLGAPHWDPDARAAIFGLTRGTGPRELVRAALESVCFQTADLIEAMQAD
jgi:glycerol kinase